jgi:group II intron reverse transcriptase/maturase
MSESAGLSDIASLASLFKAWERVRDNHGCAGVDNVTIEDFSSELETNLRRLSYELEMEVYSPLPLLRILVDKGNGEARPLSIPPVRDRVSQAAAHLVLEPIFEQQFEDCSYAYRRGRSVRQAVLRVRHYYDQGYRWVLDADIDAYFASVPHVRLMKKVSALVPDSRVHRLLRLWLEADVWDGEQVARMTVGLPQGSVISPLLANLYLDEFDDALLARGMRLVRYADDFVVLCKSQEKAIQAARLTDEILDQMDLELDEADIKTFDEGFKFLGVLFCRSVLMVPFECDRRARRVIYVPPPLDLGSYRRAGTDSKPNKTR